MVKRPVNAHAQARSNNLGFPRSKRESIQPPIIPQNLLIMSTDWTVAESLDTVRKVLRDDLRMAPVGFSEWCEDIPRRGELWFMPGYGYTYLVGPVGSPECSVIFHGGNDRTFVAYCLFSRGLDVTPVCGPPICDCPDYWKLEPPDMSLREPSTDERRFCKLPPDAIMTG